MLNCGWENLEKKLNWWTGTELRGQPYIEGERSRGEETESG